jgi:hypothetical protein
MIRWCCSPTYPSNKSGEPAILCTLSDREAMAREAGIIEEIQYGESDYEQFLRNSF